MTTAQVSLITSGKALLAGAGSAIAMMLAVLPVQAKDRQGAVVPTEADKVQATAAKPLLAYYLPKTVLHVTISQQLTACPASGGDAEVETTITVVPERAADLAARVLLDAGSGVFAKRTVRLELNADQTLAAFNSTAEGQGGPILKSIANLAFKVAAASVGPSSVDSPRKPDPLPACSDVVEAIFKKLADLNSKINNLETSIAEGKGNPAATALLADWRARRAQFRDSLTLTKRHMITDATTAQVLASVDYGEWFYPAPQMSLKDSLASVKVPGVHGFRLALTIDDNHPNHRTPEDKSKPYGSADKPHKHLVYRLPIGASVSVQPCASAASGADCTPDTSKPGQDASLTGRVALMHLSRDQFLSVGKGGLFGTRTAVAKFDALGAPSILEYGSAPASADVAGVVDAVGQGLDTLRDAETEALKRAIAKEEARKKLNDLREAAADPK